jgi:cell division protease FtsH
VAGTTPEQDPRYLDENGYFDPWEYDERRPKKNGPQNVKQLTQIEIEEARDALFANGSEFLPTHREQIVGIDNVLVTIDQIIHWLKHSKDYLKRGARPEPGIILEGDPGTGKTLVSRYIATESGAQFVNVRDFAHNGPLFRDSDIRDLFERARARYRQTNRPIILFWDEFENGACERANATPEQGATVSQLTAELDGIHGKNEGILLIGCTNYIYGIDQALRRSGRMGLQIEFHPPDREGKRRLLDHYLGLFKTKGKIDVNTLSFFFDSTATAADIEEAVNEAWRHAVRRALQSDKKRIQPKLSQDDLIEVFVERLVGPPTTFINLARDQRLKIAIHEVGHALMALVYEIPLRLITVKPGKKSLGRCITADIEEYIGTIDEMVRDMRVGVGSIAAERIAGFESLGSTGDIEGINKVAAKLVNDLYKGERTGLFSIKTVQSARGATPNSRGFMSESVLYDADQDIRELLTQVWEDGEAVMGAIGKRNLLAIAEVVNDTVTMTGAQFSELVEDVLCCEPKDYRP